MKRVISVFILSIIMTVRAFVQPPVLESVNPSALVKPALHLENVHLRKYDAMLYKTSSTSSGDLIEDSHRKFLDYPRSQYVDKTTFIEEVLWQGLQRSLPPGIKKLPIAYCLNYPQGFGKTLALSSLYYFCDYKFKNATTLFSGLKIMDQGLHSDEVREKYMGKFPVIWIDFGTVKYKTYLQNYLEIRGIISKTFQLHEYLLEGDMLERLFVKNRFLNLLHGKAEIDHVKSSISFLSQCIYEYSNIKPIILIDNYDVPYSTSYAHSCYHRIEEFMGGFKRHTIQTNRYAHRVIISTVTPILDSFSFRAPFCLFVPVATNLRPLDFTCEEVESLLQTSKSNLSFQDLKERYGGYFRENSSVFNPLSVVNSIFLNKPHQWAEMQSKEPLPEKVMFGHGLYPLLTIQQMLAGERVEKRFNRIKQICFPDLYNDEDAYWRFLAYAGYLTAAEDPEEEMMTAAGSACIPNSEVRETIQTLIKKYSKVVPSYTKFTHDVLSGNYSEARNFILKHIQEAGVYFRAENDNFNREKLCDYVVQILRGVEIRYNTTIKITENPNKKIIELEPRKGEGESVKVTIEQINTPEKSFNQTVSKLCSVPRPSGDRSAEFSILFAGKIVDMC